MNVIFETELNGWNENLAFNDWEFDGIFMNDPESIAIMSPRLIRISRMTPN